MFFRITGDSNEESGVSDVIYELSGPTRKHFEARDYGAGMHGLGVVLICRNPALNFKRRLRFSKNDKMLYMDVMLDLVQMRDAQHQDRKRVVIERLAEEIPIILRKYAFPEFDETRFMKDLKSWLTEIGSPPHVTTQ